ncbi:unnamed protein product [Penicillium glandicola]
MTSPIKLDAKLAGLSQADARLLIYGSLCYDTKINSEKLADLAGVKKTSAYTSYWRAKNRLERILREESQSPTTKRTASKSADTKAGPATETRAGTKRTAAKDAASKKSVPAPKRRKAAVKASPEPSEEPEEPTQTEKTDSSDADFDFDESAELTE